MPALSRGRPPADPGEKVMLRLFLLLTLFLLAGLAALLLTRMRSTPPLLATVVPANDTGSEPPRTTFAATLDETHVAGRNLLWCVTFQLAWEQLADVVGAPPRLA
ncbi:MAG: hypothetical protein HC895_09715, partial [Leptolyngbyaceae cyanobacterium SM1_3_5]|nr:hypothetical protein [Leptolyngbyaceae cyanobacterium SM1_3_5]